MTSLTLAAPDIFKLVQLGPHCTGPRPLPLHEFGSHSPLTLTSGPYYWQVGSWHLTEMSCMCLDWYVSTFTAVTVSLVCVFVTLESLLKLQI